MQGKGNSAGKRVKDNQLGNDGSIMMYKLSPPERR